MCKTNSLRAADWGPQMWGALHAVTFGYPSKPSPSCRARYRGFFRALARVLPCEACQTHFAALLRGHGRLKLDDRALRSRKALTRWLVNVHNHVNERLGKTTVDFAAVEARYRRMRPQHGAKGGRA